MAEAEAERRCVRMRLQQQPQPQPQPQPNNWLELPSEVVELIIKKLGLVDMIRFKAVCSSWYKAGNSYTKCQLSYSPNNQSPWLMLPTHEDESHSRFFNFAEQKEYKLKNVLIGLEFDSPRCVGSSYGWLIIFDKLSKNGCLLNPFSGARIELPSTTILDTNNIPTFGVYVSKAILLSDPNRSSSFSIVIMYGFVGTQLAFYNYKHEGGDHHHEDNNNNNNINNTWTKFGNTQLIFYSDILYHKNHLYALQYFKFHPLGSWNGSVEVWDFHHHCFPKKVATIKHNAEELPVGNFPGVQEWCYHIYLAESLDEILYVFRVSAKLNTTDNHRDYKDEFYVYKLDYSGHRWEKIMETFGDGGQALFLGGNQCISISAREFPEWEPNSLYITVRDRIDWWRQIQYFDEAHKVRVHNLQEKKAHNPFMEFNMDHLMENKKHQYSTAFWIVPNLY